MGLTRSSSKAIATTLPKDVPHLPDSAGASNKEFVPDSAEANIMFGCLTSIPGLLGTSEMPTTSITILHGTGTTSVQGSTHRTNVVAHKKLLTFIEEQSAAKQACSLAAGKLSSVKKKSECDWLSVGACLFDSALNGPSLISCQVSGYNVLIHHACQVEWENGGPGQEMGGCNKFCIGHHPAAKLLAVPDRHVAGATSELMKSISNGVQQGLTSRRVVSVFPPDSSEEELTEVKVSVSIPSCY